MMTIKKFMNRVKFLVVIFILTFSVSCGQQKRYISYKVKQGESMRDIAKRLDMKTRDLLRLNPDVGRRPSANTVIIIPNGKMTTKTVTQPSEPKVKDVTTEKIEQKTDTVKVEKIITTYKTHIAQPKETVYSLTKKYGISKAELIKLNPEYPNLKNNKLSIGDTLKVKAIETKTLVPLEEDLKGYLTHKVKPKETIYSLTRFYNVSKDELVALNTHLPNLKNDMLGINDILKIRPIKEKESGSKSNLIYQDLMEIGRTVKLALLLPFKSKEYNSVNAVDIFRGKKGRVANMVTDFYMGAEIAVDSLTKQGIDVQVKVFDTGNRGKNVPTILANNNLNENDVIIGPFYSNQANVVANRVSIPVVFPHFSNKQNTFSSSKLIKTSPNIKAHTNELIAYLKGKYNGETIFVVGDGKSKSNAQINSIVSGLRSHNQITNINILKPLNGYIKKERFTDKMKPKTHCWVILTSDDKVAVADALNSMITLPKDVTAQVFAINKNSAYDNIDNNKLANIGFTYVTNTFTNDSDKLTAIFDRKYKRKNNSLPSEYATKGFDITYDILTRLASGNKLNKTFKEGTSIRVSNKFNYNKKTFGSTDNNGLFIVQYNKDLSLKRLQ